MTEERELSVDGVSVRKWMDTGGFRVPAVSFELVSERDEAVTVRLVDRIPDSFPMERVGFHPDHGSEHWTAYPDHRVGFEYELAPDETVTTVYGVRIDEDEDIEQFDSAPELEVLVGDDSGDENGEGIEDATISDIAPQERTDVVRDVIEGDRETVPGLEDGDEDDEPPEEIFDDLGEAEASDGFVEDAGEPDTEEPPEAVDAGDEMTEFSEPDDPAAETEPGADAETEADADVEVEAETESDPGAEADTEAAGGADAEVDAGMRAEPGSVAAALAEELAAGEVEESTREQLQTALGVPQSVETRLSHLQTRVSDMEAYTDALEAFIDENGAAQELADDLEADIAAVEERTERLASDIQEDVEERLEAAEDDRAAIAADLEDLEADLDKEVDLLDDDIEGLGADLGDLEERLGELEAELEAEIEGVETDIDTLREDLEEVQHQFDQLSDVFGG